MRSLEFTLRALKRHHFLVVFTGTVIGVMLVMATVVDILGIGPAERKGIEWSLWFLISALILAPTIETLIFQKWPVDFFEDSFTRPWPLILISAIPFGIIHYLKDFLIRDAFYTFCSGVIYAYAYIVAKKREDLNPYVAVVLIHFGYNAFAVFAQWMVR